jgi:predicted nucleic acid-binding protein
LLLGRAPDPISMVDGLLAATAVHHDLVLATRNITDVERTGVECLNPFE